jgi:predicted Fe-Mo cluster-binding NifX family protein
MTTATSSYHARNKAHPYAGAFHGVSDILTESKQHKADMRSLEFLRSLSDDALLAYGYGDEAIAALRRGVLSAPH